MIISKPVAESLCPHTNARICIGRAGTRMRTNTLLRFRGDHAIAKDAVWSNENEAIIDELGFYRVQTTCQSKEEFLLYPDHGRVFSAETLADIERDCVHQPDVQVIAGDGLSSFAIDANLRDVFGIIKDGVAARGYTMGTPIFVKYSRVATMDPISEVLGAKVSFILIGERPGLATGESMSCYMAYESSSKKSESQRNVISNINKNGIPPIEAGAQILDLMDRMMAEKKSGIDLKL